MEFNLFNIIMSIGVLIVFPAGAAYGGTRFAMQQNNRDHVRYDVRHDKTDAKIDNIEEKLSAQQAEIVRVTTVVENLERVMEKIDAKLKIVCDSLSVIKGRLG